MSSSPQRPFANTEQQSVAEESPSRYQNRYGDRFFNSLTSSPPREPTLKNNPLQPSRLSEHKVYEGEKYTSFEIQNSDRGNWRESSVKDEVEQVEISSSPHQSSSTRTNTSFRSSQPTLTRTSSIKTLANATLSSSTHKKTLLQPSRSVDMPAQKQEPTSSQHQTRRNKIPHYMEATTSFYDKVQPKREPSSKDNLLRARTKGGITKRVSTPKIPRYQSTTHINAVEDIRNEMTAEDNYIPMAARIKLFEKGLGNASNKPAPIVPNKYNLSRSNSPSTSQQSKQRVSASPSASTTRRRQADSDNVPSFARQTSASATKKREHPVTTTTSKKPFRFTTSEYTSSTTFHERLNLWKVKDKQSIVENQKNRGIKRKNTDNSSPTPNSKHKSD